MTWVSYYGTAQSLVIEDCFEDPECNEGMFIDENIRFISLSLSLSLHFKSMSSGCFNYTHGILQVLPFYAVCIFKNNKWILLDPRLIYFKDLFNIYFSTYRFWEVFKKIKIFKRWLLAIIFERWMLKRSSKNQLKYSV